MGVDCFKTDFASEFPSTSSIIPARIRSACTITIRSFITAPSSTPLKKHADRDKPCCLLVLRRQADKRCRSTGAETVTRLSTSMAETLRGGLSLGLSGFVFRAQRIAFWSPHFRVRKNCFASIYKRWCALACSRAIAARQRIVSSAVALLDEARSAAVLHRIEMPGYVLSLRCRYRGARSLVASHASHAARFPDDRQGQTLDRQ